MMNYGWLNERSREKVAAFGLRWQSAAATALLADNPGHRLVSKAA